MAVQKSLSHKSGWGYSSRLDNALLTAIALPVCKTRMQGKPECPEAQKSLQWLDQNLVLHPRAWDAGAHLTLYRQLYLMDWIGSVSGDQALLKGGWRGQGAILLLKEQRISGGWDPNPSFFGVDPGASSYALLFLAHTPEEALRQE